MTPENEITQYEPSSNSQPIYKLHGSSNWVDAEGKPLLILAGNKQSAFDQLPILGLYLKQFEDDLNQANTRLMTIGYGFGDQHINHLIGSGVKQGLGIFNINPDGAEQAIKQNSTRGSGQISADTELETLFKKSIIGASRRSLREIFGEDTLEYSKVMRFLNQA